MRLEIEYLDDAEAVASFVNNQEILKENIVAINTSNDTEDGFYKNKIVIYYLC